MIRESRSLATAVTLAALAACAPTGGPDAALPPLDPTRSGQEARLLFGAERAASAGQSEVIGFYSRGCLAGARALPETGPTWQAMRLGRNRNWGHPELLDYVTGLSERVAAETSWNGLYVGDMQQPRGGPMLTGHVSHQSGLDVDIWMLPPGRLDLTRSERESLSSISTRSARGARVGENWTAEHMEVLRLAASDPRVARIFVFPGAKVWMCDNATGDRSWLRRIRPANGHHYHFHVRLGCPRGARDCESQAPPPPGDGCDAARQRAADILDPPPPDPDYVPPPPRGQLTLGDLPRQCAALLSDG
jgi:penicillin-insensitive murein endopeptidase